MADLTSKALLHLANTADAISRTGVSNATLRIWAEDQSPTIAAALRIAARVLDEEAVERLASAIANTYACRSCGGVASRDCCDRPDWELPIGRHYAQAVINYLLEGKE